MSHPVTRETRSQGLNRLRQETFDVLILGGGINGAGVLRDLTLRSKCAGVALKAALVEKHHFASGTSGKNSQLIHGGLRYLKYLEFRLVREALRERSTLLEIAPHLVRPLPFLIPMFDWFSSFFYGTGLWLYDALAGARNIARHRRLSRDEVLVLEPRISSKGLVAGALFFDCAVHSARFVLENIFEAVGHGGVAVNYVESEERVRDNGVWKITLRDTLSGERFETRARKLVDARGPWAESGPLRLVRGSHLIFPRIGSSDHAIAHFDEQGRIIFLIPWGTHRQLTLVGTTDVDHTGSPDDVRISPDEISYLLNIIRRLYPDARSLQPISSYSSLRPLVRDESDSATSTSREHRIWNSPEGILHIAGGKYTTYRSMSEEAADLVTREIAPALTSVHVTAQTPLPRTPIPQTPEAAVRQAVNSEMAQRLTDALLISSYLGYEHRWTAESLAPYAQLMGSLLGWDAKRQREEAEALEQLISVPEAACGD